MAKVQYIQDKFSHYFLPFMDWGQFCSKVKSDHKTESPMATPIKTEFSSENSSHQNSSFEIVFLSRNMTHKYGPDKQISEILSNKAIVLWQKG